MALHPISIFGREIFERALKAEIAFLHKRPQSGIDDCATWIGHNDGYLSFRNFFAGAYPVCWFLCDNNGLLHGPSEMFRRQFGTNFRKEMNVADADCLMQSFVQGTQTQLCKRLSDTVNAFAVQAVA